MTTKLIQKLNYLKTSADMIKEALQEKGALLQKDTPFRAFAQKINELAIENKGEFILTDQVYPAGNKVFVHKHHDALPTTNGHLMGSIRGVFKEPQGRIGFKRGNKLTTTDKDKDFTRWNTYLYNETDKTFTPDKDETEVTLLGNILPHPTYENMLSTAFFSSADLTQPDVMISYPSENTSFTSFKRDNLLWTGTGGYLVQSYQEGVQKADILRLCYDNITKSFSYEGFATLTPPYTGSVYRHAPAALDSGNAFGLGGKYIYYIERFTDELSSFDISSLNLPATGDLILFGKNYLILRADSGNTATFYFIKAVPHDLSSALLTEGFFANPTAYDYELMHTETATDTPKEPFTLHQNGFCSPDIAQKDYFIRPLTPYAQTIADFEYSFMPQTEADRTYQTGIFFNEELFFAFTDNIDFIPRICVKDPQTHRFIPENPALAARCYYLNEFGSATVRQNDFTSHALYQENQLVLQSTKALSHGACPLFFKNGTANGLFEANTLFYDNLTEAQTSFSIKGGMRHKVDEDFISNLYNNRLIYLSDTGTLTSFTCSNHTFNSQSAVTFKYQDTYQIFDFQNQTGTDIEGQCYTLTPNFTNNTFSVEQTGVVKGTFTATSFQMAQPVHGQNVLIDKQGFFGIYSGADDGILRFVYQPFPTAVQNLINGEIIYYIQTFYDGSCALQLYRTQKTILFTPVWDELSGTCHLKEGSFVEIYDSYADNNISKGYFIFSPFKEYMILANSYGTIAFVDYKCAPVETYLVQQDPLTPVPETQKTEHISCHLTPALTQHFNTTITTAVTETETKHLSDGRILQRVRYGRI